MNSNNLNNYWLRHQQIFLFTWKPRLAWCLPICLAVLLLLLQHAWKADRWGRRKGIALCNNYPGNNILCTRVCRLILSILIDVFNLPHSIYHNNILILITRNMINRGKFLLHLSRILSFTCKVYYKKSWTMNWLHQSYDCASVTVWMVNQCCTPTLLSSTVMMSPCTRVTWSELTWYKGIIITQSKHWDLVLATLHQS